MTEWRLHRQLEKAGRRLRHVRLVSGLAVVWLLAASGAVLAIRLVGLGAVEAGMAAAVLMASTLAIALLWVWFTYQAARDPRLLARRIERTYPELQACLLTAVDQQPALPGGRYAYLQERVIHQSLEHAYGHPWERSVPAWRLWAAHTVHGLTLIPLFLAISALAISRSPRGTETAGAPSSVLPSGDHFEVAVEPGNTEVERGSSLLVVARFVGALPAEATLLFESEPGVLATVPMTKSLDDPMFGGRIPAVKQPLTYHVRFAEQQTETYSVTVFDYPALERADARLTYPDYTSLEDKVIEDVRQISAVEGTELTLQCRLNKSVAEARLVGRDGAAFELSPDPSGEPHVYVAKLTLDKSRRLELQLRDEAGRANKDRYEFAINVLANKPPDLKLVLPSRDVQVSPLEEVELKANAWDDFGLRRVGVNYFSADGSVQDLVLSEDVAGKKRIEVQYLLAFEELKAQPDDLVSYHFWAEDVAPGGQIRRTSSDMFFAEVRPFEEIFRQGQPQAGGESQDSQQGEAGAGGEGEQLAELQKQIINGTWKVIRRETTAVPTPEYDADLTLLTEAQAQALEQASALEERLQDPQLLQHLDAAVQAMSEAVEELTRAKEGPEIPALQDGLRAEQSAYRALLKLRAREHQVARANSRSSRGSQASSRSQQQLQQLELKNDQNRYETERLAQSAADQQAQENRQVLNRLRELARRQGDINQRLKELQSALQEATDEQQREELERQLKRLREQQQELLRDTDELLSRMQQPQNEQRLNENRQELEQARNQIRQASEALEQGMVSSAVNSGARAQQQLEEVRDEMRRATSNQFAEEMRSLSESATELDQREQELARNLEELVQPSPENRSLRDRGQRQQISEDLGTQRRQLESLLERMRATVLESEETEPLLAERLHDAYRDAEQRQTSRSLESARRSLDQGLVQDASREERIAGQGIRELREGVERAAASVLGDETEALRRAHQTVDELARQLQQEMERATGRRGTESDSESDNARSPGQPQNGQGDRPQTEAQADASQSGGEPGQRDAEREATEGRSGQRQASQTAQSGRGGQRPEDDSENPQSGGGRGEPSESDQPRAGQSSGAQSSERPGERPADEERAGGSRDPNSSPDEQRQRGGPNRSGGEGLGGFEQLATEFRSEPGRVFAPLTGGDFTQWSDRLRDVEEMIGDPQLRAEAARILDRARAVRKDLRRHSEAPNWDLVQLEISQPLAELRDRLMQEILKRTSPDALVPVDRDPVPSQYQERVRRYYEQLGSGR